MKTYDNMVDAINDLKTRGYDLDFNLKENYLECANIKRQLSPNEFDIMEVYRFEGMTNPSDNSILYAIQSHDGLKGVLVNAYGVYADAVSQALVTKLNTPVPDEHIK